MEANNRIRELEGEERREIIRILTDFSIIIRPQVPAILQSYEFWQKLISSVPKPIFHSDERHQTIIGRQTDFGLDHGHTPTIATLAGQA